MEFSLENKIKVFNLDGFIKAGLFSLQDNGQYLFIKNINKDSVLYKKVNYIALEDEASLRKVISEKFKNVVTSDNDVYTYLYEFVEFLYKLTEDFTEPKNRYFLSLLEHNLPKELEEIAKKSLRIKSIHDHPDDTHVIIITLVPGDESHDSNIVWNYYYQSEDVLYNGVERVVRGYTDLNGVQKATLIHQITYFIRTRMEERLERKNLEEQSSALDILRVEGYILKNIIEKTTLANPNITQDHTEFSEETYKLWVMMERPMEFYEFAYINNSFRINHYILKMTKDDKCVVDEYEETRFRFTDLDELVNMILNWRNHKGHLVNSLLEDSDKVNLRKIIGKKYIFLDAPFSELEEIASSVPKENKDKVLKEESLEEAVKKSKKGVIGNQYNPVGELGPDPVKKQERGE